MITKEQFEKELQIIIKNAFREDIGEGDHTYNEIEILDEETYRHVTAIEFGERSPLDEMPELQDYSATSLADYTGSLKNRAAKIIEEDEEDGFVLPDDYDERAMD